MAQRLTLINFNFSPDCSGCTLKYFNIKASLQHVAGQAILYSKRCFLFYQPLSPLEIQYLSFPLSKKEKEIHRTGPTLYNTFNTIQLKGEKAFYMCSVSTQKTGIHYRKKTGGFF